MKTITPDGPPAGAILVIHSWWGLTESFRDYGSRLAEAGFVVGLSDLFAGQTARTEAEARALRARPRRIPIYKRLGADITQLLDQAGPGTQSIGVAGFSMGGHWAVWLSQRPEYPISASVLYYAARAGTFTSCKASIIAHFADRDPWVSVNARKTMERAIRRAGCPYDAFDYPGTGHWFAETDRRDAYDKAAASTALARDLNHFKSRLTG